MITLKTERDNGVYTNGRTDGWTYIPQHKAESKEEDDREDGEDAGNSDTKQHAQLVLARCSVCVSQCVMVFIIR
jgi:hypothetical protein